MDRLVTNLAFMMWGNDHRKRHDHLKVVLANLLEVNTADPFRYLGFHRAHDFYTGLYNNPAGISRLIGKVMDSLTKERLIEHHRGRWQAKYNMGYVSKARATQDLMNLFHIYGLTPAVTTRHPDTEVIILKDHKKWAFKNGRLDKAGGKYLDYEDTPEVIAMRERLRNYNRFMAEVELKYDGDVLPVGPTRRIFNGGWNSGGRFYGGFWQSKPSEERLKIHLNGEAVTELDYGSLHAHILYSRVGVVPTGDLYDLPDVPRSMAKSAVLLMIGARRKSSVLRNLDDALRKGDYEMSAENIVSALETHHPALSDLWYKGMGLDLQNVDARICDKVLTELSNFGIPCLGVYDSFVVPRQHVEKLRAVMVESFKEVTGASYDPPIG